MTLRRALQGACGTLVLGLMLPATPSQAAVFTVTSTGDQGDWAVADGTCSIGPPSNVCTLRAAIEEANAFGGPDSIQFAIAPGGPQTIVLGGGLPALAETAAIDGTTQPGFVATPIIEIDASASTSSAVIVSGSGASGSVVRGLVINRCQAAAIRIGNSSDNVIAGNFLGTNITGTAALGNDVGVSIGGAAEPANNNRVGGTTTADRNVISGNGNDGVLIAGATTTGTLVEGNLIGTDVTGTVSIPNLRGIEITAGASNNTVGGSVAGARNVISGNTLHGVEIGGAGTSGTRLAGNVIGLDASASAALGNGGAGVVVSLGAVGNSIGEGFAANVIAYNGLEGVSIVGTGTGNAILGNAIFSNSRLGIDLNGDGATLNDAFDPDAGPNDLLNFPEVTGASEVAGTVSVGFILDVPMGSYRIEFFKNPSGFDPSGYGEGQVPVGSRNVDHPGGGPLAFNHSFPGSLGDVITATTTVCTDAPVCAAFGSTSEFSNAVMVLPPADLEITKTDDLDPVDVGGTLTYTLTVTNHGPSNATLVTATDVLPPELEYQSDTPSQGVCSYAAPTLTCDLGSIVASGSATITLVVRPTAVATVTNAATVAGNEPDPATGNNSVTETTEIQVAAEGVRFFTITSTFQQNLLEWLNPPGPDYDYTEIVYRTDTFPAATVEPGTTSIYTGGTAGLKDSFIHDTGAGSNGQTFYYAAFVHRLAPPPVSAPRYCTGRPFDNSGPTRWAFSTGAFSITPPTVGTAAVVAPANDGALYAMDRGPLGGQWPTNWEPAQLGVVQTRSPVIPLTVNGANPVVYLGAQDGNVYVVDGISGGAAAFPWGPTSIAGMVQAAPAGMFSVWGGVDNYLLVGTRDDGADNAFVAINPDVPGNVIDTFTNGGGPNGIGIITGMAAVDYATDRVYFTSYENPTGTSSTLWCLKLGPAPGVFTKVWERALGNIDGSPVVQNGRVYVGSTNGGGTVYSINGTTGAAVDDRTFVHGDGPVKGFVWPDRLSNDLYFATNNLVWGITDTGAPAMTDKFGGGISLGGTPSAVLFVQGTQLIYVGASDGYLWEIDVLGGPFLRAEPLGDTQAVVGAPSYDWPNGLIHVGTEAGIFYAVAAPLTTWGSCVVGAGSCSGQPDGTPCTCSFPPCVDICVSGLCTGGC